MRLGRTAIFKFTIAGYYGFGNLGDEAVLASMVADFRFRFPGARFEIVGASYQKTLSGDDVTQIHWTDWPGLIASIRNCDCLIVGGGGLFNCYLPYSGKDFLRPSQNLASLIFGLPVLAHLFGKRCCVYAVGASRFFSDEALEHARMAVRMADLCTVRDHGSRQIIGAGILQRLRIAIHADPAFRLINSAIPEQSLERAGIRFQDGPVVAVVLRNWQFEGEQARWEKALAEALRRFAERSGARLLFLPFQSTDDVENELSNDPVLIQRMRKQIGHEVTATLAPECTPGEISAILGSCEMVVGMRLHANILAIRNGTPLVSIGYDPKVFRVMAECGLRHLVAPLPTNGPEALYERLESVWQGRGQMRRQLQGIAVRMADDAGKHVDHLAALLQQEPRPQSDAEITRFVTRLASEQTQRLAIADTALVQADVEALSCLTGIRNLANSGAYEPALRFLELWKPASVEARTEREYLLGFCLQSLGREPEAALQHYAAALAGGFDEFWVRYHRSQLLFTLGRREEAVSDLTAARKLRPEHADAAQLLAQWVDTAVAP